MATSSGINYSCANLGQEFFLPEVYLSSCDYAAFRGSMPAYFIDLLSSTHSQGCESQTVICLQNAPISTCFLTFAQLFQHAGLRYVHEKLSCASNQHFLVTESSLLSAFAEARADLRIGGDA